MAEEQSGEKTEAPTGKRLQDAREEGQIAKSPEFATAAVLLGFTLVFSFAGPQLWSFLLDAMGNSLASAGTTERMGDGLIPWIQFMSFKTMAAMLAVASAMAVIGVLVQAAQTGGLLTFKPLQPKWSRLNPLTNIKNILGKQAFAQLAKSMLKMGIVGWAVYATIGNGWTEIQALALSPSPMALLDVVRRYGFAMLRNAGLMFLVLACGDYAFQRWKTWEDLKMTRQQVKDEAKQQEGNMEMKSRRRSIARERIRRQMFAAVPKADVVIVNPTHIAIAIKYDPALAPAPYVVALGERKIAERIKALAFQHGVPVIENKPLARALIKVAKVGTVIPVEMYLAVAEVLAFVMRQRQQHSSRWRGTAAA